MILSEQQIMIRDMARQFAQEQLAPHAAEWDAEARFPQEAVDAMGALGLMGMLVPEEWGGAGIDRVSYALAVEELAAGDGSCSTIMTVHNSVGCVPILQYGTQAQKERFLRPLAKGEMLACFCLTEPSTGSDAAAIKTRARRDGNHWVLDGTKQFITNGSTADLAIVFAVSDPAKGKKGITRLPGADGHAGLQGGAPREEARPARLRHGADRARELPAHARSDAGPGGRGLSHRARQSRGRPHRHRRPGHRHGARRLRGGARLRQGAPDLRHRHRRITRPCSSASPIWRRRSRRRGR